MVNQYMSSQEAEARSIYASNPTTAGYMGGSYSSQRWHEQQRQRDEEQRRQEQYRDNRPSGYVSGTFNPATGETTGGHPAEAQMAQDRARSGMTQQQTRDMNMGYDEYRRSRPVEEAQGRFQSAPKDYYDRPDIFKPDDPAQLNLIRQGYTPEQSAEMLRVDAAKRQDYAAERKYETLRQQADATTVSVSSGYHHWAKDTGLPQAPNPFEYAGDLALYAEKGYPRKESERFSPVDATVLNLSEGRGGQDYVWLPDSQRNYDLRGAMDTIAQAKRSGTMGAYGQLGSPSSSKYGTLSLADQQDIARYVNENPVHQAMGFRTNDEIANQRTDEIVNSWRGAYVSSVNPTIQSQAKSEEDPFKNATVQEIYHPGEAALAVNNLYGGEKDQNIVNQFTGGIIRWITPGTMEKKYTGASVQTPEGDPYEVNGKMYQDYKITTPTKSEFTYVPSGFEVGEQETAKRTTFWMPEVKPINTGSPLDYPENALRGIYMGIKEKPNTAAINAGTSAIITAATFGYVNPATESVAVNAITSGSRWAIPAAAANVGVKYVAPGAMVTLYSYDFYQTTTKEGTDFSPQAAYRGGYRGGYETLPFIAGAGATSVGMRQLTLSDINYKSSLQAKDTTGRFDYYVKQPVKNVVRSATEDYRQIKLEAMNQGRPTTPTMNAEGTVTSQKNWGEISTKVKANKAQPSTFSNENARLELAKSGLETERFSRPKGATQTTWKDTMLAAKETAKARKAAGLEAPVKAEPVQVSRISPEMTEFTGKLSASKTTNAPAEPALGRNVNGEIKFGVRDYLGYKAGKFVAEVKGRFDTDVMRPVAAEPTTIAPEKYISSGAKLVQDNYGKTIVDRAGKPFELSKKGIPEVEEGYTRLYRGEEKGFFGKPVSKESPTGRWFTSDVQYATERAEGRGLSFGQKRASINPGQVTYVDVPTSGLSNTKGDFLVSPEQAMSKKVYSPDMLIGNTQKVTNEEMLLGAAKKAYPAAKEKPVSLETFKSYAPESATVNKKGYAVKYNRYGEPSGAEIGVGKRTPEDYFYAKTEKVYKGDKFSSENILKAAGVGKKVAPEENLFYNSGSNKGNWINSQEEIALGEKAYGKPKPVREQALNFLTTIGGIKEEVRVANYWKGGVGGEKPAPAITKGTPPNTPAAGIKFSRLTGTKVVGGKTVTALSKEPSLSSLGKTERTGSFGEGAVARGQKGSTLSIGQSTDFRQQPRGAMKPFTKQAAGQFPIMSEPLPMVEGMPTTRMSQNTSRGSAHMVSVVHPEMEFMQKQSVKQERGFSIASMLGSRFGQQSEVRQAISQRSGLETQQRIKQQGMGQETKPIRAVMPLRVTGLVQGTEPKTRLDTKIGLTTLTIPKQLTGQRQGQEPIQRQRPIQDQMQRFRQEQLYATDKLPKGITGMVPFALPGIGYGAGQGGLKVRSGRKHTELFSTAFGTLSASMFSGSGFGGGEAAPRQKSVYGNYRGQFTTARGKTIRVKPMPKRMYDV